jgi:serine phosphatase RsbU (regulator of sigma subunit)
MTPGASPANPPAARRIAVAATPAGMARASSLAAALPSLVGDGATAEAMPLGERSAAAAEGALAVVAVVAAGDVPEGLSATLDAAEAARVGVLMMVGGGAAEARAGAVATERIDADDASVAAVLRGMASRQREVERLVRELAAASRFTGGLRGEIARMQEELQLAAQVQREFLPRDFPEVGSVRIAAFWRPASYVSGDVYDVVRLDERHVGVFIADAVGHGVPAALLTMVICRGLPTKDVGKGSYRIVPPGEALARINAEMLRHQGRTTRFATAVYAVVDCATGEVRLASAGHPPPVILRSGGATEAANVTGGLLGVFEGEQYPEASLALGPGDRLLIHSDGFEQAFPGEPTAAGRAERVPTKRFVEEFEAVRGADGAAALVEQVGRRIDMQFGSVHQADDVTLLVVERLRDAAG